jgi:hypothetical protein
MDAVCKTSFEGMTAYTQCRAIVAFNKKITELVFMRLVTRGAFDIIPVYIQIVSGGSVKPYRPAN